MKKTLIVLVLLGLVIMLNGCISPIPSGTLFSGATMPHSAVDKDVSYTKKGIALSHSILGLIAWGDGGIKTATKNGNIKKLKFMDYNIYNIGGVYLLYRTEAYGD